MYDDELEKTDKHQLCDLLADELQKVTVMAVEVTDSR